MYLYSKSKNLFYLKENIDNYKITGVLPGDCIDVTDEVFNTYSGNPPPGKVRIAGEDGMPDWGDIPSPTRDELIAIVENERQRLLAYADVVMQDWRTELMLGEISDDNKAKLSEWLAYKNEVKSIDVTANPEHINWPALPKV